MIFRHSIPAAKPDDIIAWADSSGLKVDGHSFDSMRTPQLIEPMRAMADFDTRIGTLIKPVQIGGSTAGEVVAAWWAAFYHGMIQYNWQDDLKAKDRWHDRITKTLNSCRDIKRTGNHLDELICEARYINSTVRVQGVFNESALDSDTVPLQINEEIHLWKPGFLSKARRRQTQVWNAKAFDISNASNENDQLHSAFEDGTQEHWQSTCPGCGQPHEMHFRFSPTKPELGGLRWDSDGCKMDGGRFNYNKLERTIRYQMPCGHEVKDHASERRRIKGAYSHAKNEGAHVSHRSWNFEAVSCDSIRWLTLIQEWHSAIRAQRSGDIEPMRRFVTERECRFWGEDSIPFSGAIVLKSEIKKSREGLEGRAVRLWAADKQRGYRSKGELSHYWLVIRDVMPDASSQLVFEGQVSTDTELLAVLDEHQCERYAGGVDGTWDTKHVKEFCFRNGLNMFAANASHKGGFLHSDKVRRFYDDGKLLHLDLNMPPRFDYTYSADGVVPSQAEPTIISYNLAGMLENFFFIRSHEQNVKANGGSDFIAWEVPGDVSEDYQKQIDCWERVSVKQRKTNDEVEGFRKRYEADHMTMCEAYIAMMMEIGGFISSRLTEMGVERNK
jgi:hypothetical protein